MAISDIPTGMRYLWLIGCGFILGYVVMDNTIMIIGDANTGLSGVLPLLRVVDMFHAMESQIVEAAQSMGNEIYESISMCFLEIDE